VVDGVRSVVEATPGVSVVAPVAALASSDSSDSSVLGLPDVPTLRVPLGRVVGARSGDKGGNANVGVWARTDEAFAWLSGYLTVSRLQSLLPEAAGLRVLRVDLPNLRALNFVVYGLLEEGVAASTRMDAQAKGFGEYLRAKHVDVPVSLLPPG
jgi:hypothetical protein